MMMIYMFICLLFNLHAKATVNEPVIQPKVEEKKIEEKVVPINASNPIFKIALLNKRFLEDEYGEKTGFYGLINYNRNKPIKKIVFTVELLDANNEKLHVCEIATKPEYINSFGQNIPMEGCYFEDTNQAVYSKIVDAKIVELDQPVIRNINVQKSSKELFYELAKLGIEATGQESNFEQNILAMLSTLK